MKLINTIGLIIFAASFLIINTAFAEDKGATITFKVTGIEKVQGKLRYSLVASKESYESDSHDSSFSKGKVDITGKEMLLKIDNVPAGEYAMKLHHDENSNGEVDRNFIRIPTEIYGFSNNARGTIAPPDWEKAMFKHDGKPQTLSIHLK